MADDASDVDAVWAARGGLVDVGSSDARLSALVLYIFMPVVGIGVCCLTVFFFQEEISRSPIIAYAVFGSAFLATVFGTYTFVHRDVDDAFALKLLGVNVALIVLLAALLHQAFGLTTSGEHPLWPDRQSHRFSDALYFSIVTFTTLGYGDFQPHPTLRLAAAFHALIGYTYLGLLVAVSYDQLRRAQEAAPSGAGRQWTLREVGSFLRRSIRKIGALGSLINQRSPAKKGEPDGHAQADEEGRQTDNSSYN